MVAGKERRKRSACRCLRVSTHLGVDGDELRLGLELKLAHPDEVLVDLGQALLAPVLQVLREELQLSRNTLQRLAVVAGQLSSHVRGATTTTKVTQVSDRDTRVSAM